jgi:hypothetical protein
MYARPEELSRSCSGFFDPTGYGAEHVAVAEMLNGRETRIEAILAVWRRRC